MSGQVFTPVSATLHRHGFVVVDVILFSFCIVTMTLTSLLWPKMLASALLSKGQRNDMKHGRIGSSLLSSALVLHTACRRTAGTVGTNGIS